MDALERLDGKTASPGYLIRIIVAVYCAFFNRSENLT